MEHILQGITASYTYTDKCSILLSAFDLLTFKEGLINRSLYANYFLCDMDK